MDSQPDADPANAGSILTRDPYPTINAVAARRLRGFLDALKAEGIYVNLNLKVGYTFRPPVDGVPALERDAAYPTQSKPLHMIHPRGIALQKEFTRRVLDALELGSDPVLAMVEINNESSLVYAWQNGSLERDATGVYHAELVNEWNRWLAGKYASTASRRTCWLAGRGGSKFTLLRKRSATAVRRRARRGWK
jgi:hypothetical protein